MILGDSENYFMNTSPDQEEYRTEGLGEIDFLYGVFFIKQIKAAV